MDVYRKIIRVIIGFFAMGLWTFGTYRIAHNLGQRTNTPQQAVEAFVRHLPKAFANVSVLPDKAEANGGYFVAGQMPNNEYVVFYTTLQNGRWTTYLIQHVSIPEENSNKPTINSYVAFSRPRLVVLSTKGDGNIGSVIGYQYRSNVSFSLVRIGNLPLWAYKFPDPNANVDMNRYVIYDKNGKVLVSRT